MSAKDRATEEEVRRFLDFVRALNPDLSVKPEEFGYSDPVSMCLDAVLSVNRRYKEFVIPRLKSFRERFPTVLSLQALKRLLEEYGYEGFREVWQYKDPKRARTLDLLVTVFLEYKERCGAKDDLEAMRNWAENVDIKKSRPLDVPGIGFKTAQYLRMMLGVATVKPDVHIQRAVELGIGRRLPDRGAIALVEEAARRLNVAPTTLDHGIWKRMSTQWLTGKVK